MRSRPGNSSHKWKGTRVWHGVDGEAVAAFLESFVTHEAAVTVNGKVLAEYVRLQMGAGELTAWDVALFAGDDPHHRTILGGLPCLMNERSPNERSYDLDEQKRNGRYTIRRLLAPRDEAIDLDATAYQEALEITQRDWHRDPGRSRRKSPPETPSGPAIRLVRGRLAPERGLLLLYPLDPSKADIDFDRAVIGFGVSFPATDPGRQVSYTVNNIYYDQEFGATV